MIVKPLKSKIIVKPDQRFKSELLDLTQVQGADTSGIVVAAGPEALDQGLNIGDKVHFGTVAADVSNEYLKFEPLILNGERHLKMDWQDVCFVEEV